jgi:hypothetical protein
LQAFRDAPATRRANVSARTPGALAFAPMRRLAVFACLLALPGAVACGGGDDTEDARQAAEGYVQKLGKLQQQFLRAAERTNAQFRGRDCTQVMQTALDSIAPAQLRQFSGAKIENVKVDGDQGTFRYTLGQIRVDGKVAKEDGDWKVSCCVPGR